MPFERQTTAATLQAVLTETPRLSRPHGVLGSVVAGLLVGDPAARLGASQVRALLDSEASTTSAATAQRTVPVAPGAGAPSAQPTGAGARRGRGVLVGLAALAAVLLLVGGVLIGRFALAPSAPEAMAETVTHGAGRRRRESGPRFGQLCQRIAALRRAVARPGRVDLQRRARHRVLHVSRLFGSTGDEVDYPGRKALARYGEGFCAAFFTSNGIVSAGKGTVLRFAAVVPTEQAWNLSTRVANDDNSDNDDRGSKRIHCALWRADGAKLRTSALASP